ncbi:MAG: hypothetical protein ACJ79K_05935 [Gemmatimonadaceae bacterium]
MTIAPAPADSIPYYVVFNVLDGYPHWTAEIVFTAFSLALVLLLVANLRGWFTMPRPVRSGAILVLLAMALVLLPSHVFAHRDFAAMRDAVRAGKFTLVEGRVDDFHAPWRLNQQRTIPEKFTVYSHKQTFRYRYLESELAPGFNTPSDRGGPIRSGLRVRIADVDGRIARLEIAPDGGSTAPGYIGETARP